MQLYRANLGSRLAQPPPLTTIEALGYLQQVHTPQQVLVCIRVYTCDNGRLRETQCRIATPQVLWSLASLHAAGVAVLDLKPANLLFDDVGR